jgi:murein DD-endopeptidase MepM/ murein hydrolase activator NlpD
MVSDSMSKPNKKSGKWRNKFRLVILNDHDFEEKLSLKLSRLNVFVVLSISAIVLIAITILLIAFTPLKEYIPGYSSTALKRQAYSNVLKVDSLERTILQYEQYLKIIRGVISDEPLDFLPGSEDREADAVAVGKLEPSTADSALRSLVEQEELFNIQRTSALSPLSSYAFFTPVRGEITQAFLPDEGHFAVDIVTRPNEPVKACLSGTVVLAEFSAQTGYNIVIQHSNNLISVYKHNSVLFKKQGDIVRASEVIGMVGNTGELSTGPHLHFELWYESRPINPELFIRF